MDSDQLPTAKRRRVLVFCNHCEQRLPTSTYYRHREQFFDPVSQHWHKDAIDSSDSSDEEVPDSIFQGNYNIIRWLFDTRLRIKANVHELPDDWAYIYM